MTTTEMSRALDEVLEGFVRERGIHDSELKFESAKGGSFGDWTTSAAFPLAKHLGVPPLKVAQELAVYVQEAAIEGVESVTAVAPGYVNVACDQSFFCQLLNDILTSEGTYGTNQTLQGELWAIEHTSPNPNKAMHLGHLRNNLIGMSIGRILEMSGASVIHEAVDNNRGIAIAKLMWGFLAHMRKDVATPVDVAYWNEHRDAWYTPRELFLLPDVFVSQCYVRGDQDSKDEASDAKIRALVVAWEQGDAAVRELWSHVLTYSYEGMQRTLARLGNRWDVVWHEHEHYEKGRTYVEEGLQKGVFHALEDGAVVTDLAAYNVPDTIVLKRDRTTLYITQDIALTALKKARHHANHLVWVVGPEQSTALRQLFAVCEQLGIGAQSEFTHVSYGYVGLKDQEGTFKKMSSREGTVVLIDDVIDAVRDSLLAGPISESAVVDKEALAETLARGAVKFSVLKTERTQDIAFDVKRSVEIKGDSGVYIMYAYVRTHSIIRKARAAGKTHTPARHPSGLAVTRVLLGYPHSVVRAKDDLSPHHIAQYLLGLAAAFNHWYAHEVILDGGEAEAHKLAIVEAVGMVLRSGLAALNIEPVDEM